MQACFVGSVGCVAEDPAWGPDASCSQALLSGVVGAGAASRERAVC